MKIKAHQVSYGFGIFYGLITVALAGLCLVNWTVEPLGDVLTYFMITALWMCLGGYEERDSLRQDVEDAKERMIKEGDKLRNHIRGVSPGMW